MSMASCPHCKAELPEVGRFCAACGALLLDDPAATRQLPMADADETRKTVMDDPAATRVMSSAGLVVRERDAEVTGPASTPRFASTDESGRSGTPRGSTAPERSAGSDDPASTTRTRAAHEAAASAPHAHRRGRTAAIVAMCACIAALSSLATIVAYRHAGSEPAPTAVAETRAPLAEAVAGRASDPVAVDEAGGMRRSKGSRAARERAQYGSTTTAPAPANRASRTIAAGAPVAAPAPAPATAAARPASAPSAPSAWDVVKPVPVAAAADNRPPRALGPAPAPPSAPPVAAAPASPPKSPAPAVPAVPAAQAAVPSGVYLGDSNAEEAPPSEQDLSERKQSEVFADGIRFVMKTHQSQVGACYERAMKDEQISRGGKVEVEFTIEKDGRAHKVQVVTNNTGKDTLGACLTQRIADWKFPRPTADFHAAYPFIFAAGSGR